MGKKLKNLLLLLWAFSLYSCSSYKKTLYLQDLSSRDVTNPNSNAQPIQIQAGDILDIKAISQNTAVTTQINFTDVKSGAYKVDETGNILFPLIGSVKVAGLTTTEVKSAIEKKLQVFVKEPIVAVSITYFKVSVLGDVSRPGVYEVPNERITVLEALSYAGDLNLTAERNDVVVIRETEGERQVGHLNLTSKNILNSPYYYLKKNDVIYAKPGSLKYASVSRGQRIVPIVIPALSVIVSMAVLLTK